ncbi:alpha-ketoglutarate-dependent dioxygenase alkB homolog 6 [Fundulus heteroclitus]|uniref:alpha-ketoglutarate-dependent dioxygenase alkB homolog 6 n=1 Tax=Fundulus heteroclitus TaxID=8078 RepID=UPI00165B441C|nr:alpha-ketoglutarate-dependent dioxygenase alkB homolog 6 [Fundulus heteroclitus]
MQRPPAVVEDLQRFVVSEAPQTVYYVPDFISPEEESYLLQQVYRAPRTKWTQLSGRRLQNWGGVPHPRGMLGEELPAWLQNYCEKISSLGAFGGKTANHVLVNEYKRGEGIMPHQDGPLYHPTVTTVSLGSHALLDFYRPVGGPDGEAAQSVESRYQFSLLVRPRSLLVLQDDAYRRLLHGIQERQQDTLTERVANLGAAGARPGDTLSRTTRVSLTIRHVPKVMKTKLVLGRK